VAQSSAQVKSCQRGFVGSARNEFIKVYFGKAAAGAVQWRQCENTKSRKTRCGDFILPSEAMRGILPDHKMGAKAMVDARRFSGPAAMRDVRDGINATS